MEEFLREDGYLSVQDCQDINKIVFHPNLNVILIFTNKIIHILDANSGAVLQRVSNGGADNKFIKGKYLSEHDKVLFWNDKNLGLRSDYNGVLLLDTILQAPIANTDNCVKIELLLSEALLLHQSLVSLEQQGVENSADVTNELFLKISEAQQRAKKGIKAQKWETVCLELPHSSLKVVASTMVMELKSLQRHIPALSIASAVNERLTDLIVGGRVIENDQIQRFHMYSEAARRKTFDSWPHMDYKWALPDQMAQAGFYHQSSESGDDRAMCFTCSVCLVCWEKTDEPWGEHERHSPDCPFLKGEYTQNVPLSVTLATSPAVPIDDSDIISSGDSSNIVCTANSKTGDICVWNVERQLGRSAFFNIKSCEENILKRHDIEDDLNTKLSALCTFKKQTVFKLKEGGLEKTKTGVKGTRIVAGVKCNWKANAADDDKEQAFEMCRINSRKCFLVLYAVTDIPKTASKTLASAVTNGNVNDDQAAYHAPPKSGNSLITILESSYEERLDGFDDFLKYIDNKELSKMGLNELSVGKNTWSFVSQPQIASTTSTTVTQNKINETEMDSAKAPTMNGPSSISSAVAAVGHPKTQLKNKHENDVICLPIQTVHVPCDEDYEIQEMHTSCDNRYLLVALKSQEIVFMETDDVDARSQLGSATQIIVFEIDDKGLLLETPVCKRKLSGGEIPVEFCMLPKFDTNGRVFSGSPFETNAFVISCVDGSVKILSITTLKTLSEAKVENEKFISSVYCKNLERLCVCTASGSLHFYSFYDLDNDSSDEIEDEAIAEPVKTSPMPSTSAAQPNTQQKIDLIAHRKDLSVNDLKMLYSLTLFDEMLTPYSAEVPGCWTELVQAQKQRRHPQNLSPGEDTHLIRTWRLHNDATTWDEHLIELSLPKVTSLGHIDFKFSILQPCSNPPAIQVTLLKQRSIGLCCRRKPGGKQTESDSSIDVDDNIDYNINNPSASCSSNANLNSTIENPVLSEEYLQARNAEILAGPIELSSCMDLNEQGGMVTFVSPKLLKSKARNYLLHIKTMTDVAKDGQNKTRVPVRKQKGITSVLLSSFANKENNKIERLTFDSNSRNAKMHANDEFYIGCDWLHEISISIRATRETNIANERLQRLAMLESNVLIHNLLQKIENSNNSLIQNLAIDILNWILTIRLARLRCPPNYASADINSQQVFCVSVIEEHLRSLISKCIILNNRSMAHKCVKLIINTSHGAQNMVDQKQCLGFENALKSAILASIPSITKTSHAGSLRWFTMLITATSNYDSQGPISIAIIRLLLDVLVEMSKRTNSLNSILQSRFGLYGMPFESELFDAEVPSFGKGTNLSYCNIFLPKTNAGGVSNGAQQQQQQQQNQFSDLKSFCSGDNSELRIPMHLRRKSISNHIKGLLEVEPLHFVCCSTSEATRIENMDSTSQAANIIDDIMIETPSQMNIGTSKLVASDHVIKMPNETVISNDIDLDSKNSQYMLAKNVVDKMFYSHMKKHKFKDSSLMSESMLNNLALFTGDEELMLLQQGSTDKNSPSDDANARNEANSGSVYSNKVREFIEERNREDSASPILPWHKILSVPSKQMIVVDRMHSGARRQVTLDFGFPVLLTDIIIPACNDLASLTIDTWCFDEDSDCVRLAISSDIGAKALILSDLQPPPVCRFLRLTFMGRYGMSATRCKLPMGMFYGHVVILDKDSYADPVMRFVKNKKSYIQTQLKVLNALYEDTHCRYCLSSSKLAELLQPLLKSDNSNMSHMQSYLNRLKETEDYSQEFVKISGVYEECITFQNQLNVVRNVIRRLEKSLEEEGSHQNEPENSLQTLCTDKLRVISECLVELLLHFVITYGQQSIAALHNFFDLNTCNLMFKTLVINGDSHIRIATCSMLVKMCSYAVKPWWGNFFSDTFTTLFSSQNVEVFPQDRVFILLTYLGRKSIQIGTCRTIVIDSILKTIANLLAPISSNYENRLGIWRNTDLTLLSWLLLFLSVCLDDNNEKKENTNPRWDFMSGDMVKAKLSMSNSSSRSFSRSFKKRFIQNKQGSSNQNIAEKVYMMSEQIANAPALAASGNLDSVINKAQDLKNHLKKLLPPNESEFIFGKNFLKKSSSLSETTPKASSSSAGSVNKNENTDESPFDRGLKSIKTQNMLVVIRGLIGLLLNMDFTCNMDLFLLTCKIIAKLVNACKVSIQLSSIMTTTQLLQLVRIAVWENQQHPWAVHAITCLLQDILEADRSYKCSDDDPLSMDVDSSSGLSLAQALAFNADFLSSSASTTSTSAAAANGQSSSSSIFKDLCYGDFRTDASKYQLPSLMEDDTDGIEDILDDILEQSKKLTQTSLGTSLSANKKDSLPQPALPARNAFEVLYRSKVSSTMDARLCLDINTEIYLRRLIMKSSINLIASLPHCEVKEVNNPEIPSWPSSITNAWNNAEYQQKIDTNIMLMEVFETIFTDLHLQDSWLNLEQVLQLWLTLNGDNSGNETSKIVFTNLQSKIPFGEKAVNGLLKALASHPALKIRGWCLGFLCLIYSMSTKGNISEVDESGLFEGNYSKKIGQLIIQNENFERMLLRFFSGIYKNNSIQSSVYAGPTMCRLLQEMFACLQNKCQQRENLKDIQLRVCHSLVQSDGAISKQLGPIDAQSQLIKELLSYQYQRSDLGIAMSLIECVANLVHHYITNVDKIQCQKSSEVNSNSNNVFGSLFATVLGSESAQSKTVTDSTILMNLLKLSSILVRTKLPTPAVPNEDITMASSNECQTDEIKAEQQQNPNPRSAPPTFTDNVLQHFPTMNKLLGALSHCNASSAALLVICSIYSPMYNESKNTFSDPMSVEDALFQLIIYMNKLASEPVLVIKPLFDYINFVSNVRHAMPKIYLSEPFLWFILKILETPAALEVFCEMGGIKIIAENLVKSNRTLLNMQPNLVTMIMQHLSKTQSLQGVASSVITKKATTSLSSKHEEGLINFAPYCTISSENPSAQSAEVLIQGQVASHRRARAAAWSYLFYPNESHVDLILTLPTAVLLKEIQLQPHLSTLASCPSAVAIEISRDGMCNPIPITQPISTVGMTCIRLKFSQPEIATHLVIRLYRPKDSASIGLTQISLLGTTIFSDISSSSRNTTPMAGANGSDLYGSEDENQSETSFGWLRILAQCFNVATFNADSNLSNIVISSASEVNGFMEACCSLLSVAPSMSNYLLQNLETVLLKLGLHCRELSLKLMNILLNESIPHFFKTCNETISDILYQLCTTSDSFARDRMQMMIEWLMSLERNGQLANINPNSGYIKCLASILWQAYATNLVLDIGNLISIELFETLYGWLENVLPPNSPMKISIDSMMCSICCIRPEYFNLMLRKMSVLVPNHRLSDDRKDNENITDDNKQHENDTEEWYCHYSIGNLATLSLSSSQLQTIAMACQSPLAIGQLIDSGLPNLFTSAILEFCHRMSSHHDVNQPHSSKCLTDSDKASPYPMISVRKITEILEFFSEICAEGHMRDWLGSYEGSVFWEPLLTLLCNNKLQSSYRANDDINNQQYLELEETVIKFLSNVTSCHPKNQDTLTTNLISVIRTTERNNYNNLHLNAPSTSSSSSSSSPLNMKYSISGFTRRLVLQILLESEKIVVSVRSELPLLKKYDSGMTYISSHPSKKPNSHHLLFYVSINTKCHEILENSISVFNNLLPSLSSADASAAAATRAPATDFPLDTRTEKKDLWDFGMQMNFGMDFLSVAAAAGVTAKDKRSKELKNQENAQRTKEFFNVFKMKPDEMKGSIGTIPDSIQLLHCDCPEVLLTSDTTIAQILTMLKSSGISLSTPCINLNLMQLKGGSSASEEIGIASKASDFNPLPSPLQIFSTRGGLSLLAHYLPTVYPEQPKTSSQKLTDKDKNFQGEWVKGEWIKIEPNEEIYEDVDDALLESSTKASNVISSVPQHSLAAFGLFLKLPAYSEVLLRDKIRAQCLLRLILGVTGDGEGNDIYSLALSSSLPTLPFEVLRQLLDSSPITTDDGVLLRRMIVEVGAIHLVLNCLSIFTHQSSNIAPGPELLKNTQMKTSLGEEHISSDDKSHVYWAKGTGFGTGSTQQSWNVEQALLKQKSEEEHVTVLLQVLSSYMNPGDIIPNAEASDAPSLSYNTEICELPPLFLDLLQQSCLIPALCSYLRNDSVLDITRHIPLYRAILQLLRALSISAQLAQLLVLKQENDTKTSIANLLYNMKSCVDIYASKLKINKKSNLKGQSQKISINLDESDDEGLALLIPDIQETTALVQSATFSETNLKDEQQQMNAGIEYSIASSVEHKYMEVMKKLQFDTFDMIVESDNQGYRFTVSHHFESNVRMAGSDRGHPARVKRLAQEAVTLSTSLPLSYSSSVFVRCDTDRLDIMKVLITGPSDTPYANGCFEFDVYFPHDYPNSPMMINLETTGRHSVRFNPNLYNDGKVCLSVLNTWHGRPEEKWNAQTSSFLQVLVSIQSLILVSEPYFNEPGFERSRGTPSGNHSSREYNSNIYQACVKWAMLEQIRNPSPCFKDVINAHFWLKRNEICQQVENWIAELSRPQVSERSGRAISFNSMVLRRQYRQLREEFAKLPIPEGLENFDNPFCVNPPASSSATSSSTTSTALALPSPLLPSQLLHSTPKDGKIEEKTLLEILNSIDDEKKVENELLMMAESNISDDNDELLNLQDTITKMITEDMGE